MRVLVTGASGYLGRGVVEALRRRGVPVRALDLPRSSASSQRLDGVEEIFADLCGSSDLERACRGVDAVIHLAARLAGARDEVVRTAVTGTERLLDAMARAGVPRLILASSLSVYDWSRARDLLDEESALEADLAGRDAYAEAKLRQERLARDRCAASGLALTVLRPGVIWGAGRELPPTLGLKAGPLHFVFAPARSFPAVHVDNCADAFAFAALSPGAVSSTFNVVDHPEVSAGRFLRDHLRRSGRRGMLVPTPYGLALTAVRLIHGLTPGSLRGRLPGFAAPRRFTARYAPQRVSGERIRATLGWRPPLGYEECLDRTYGP